MDGWDRKVKVCYNIAEVAKILSNKLASQMVVQKMSLFSIN